MDIDLHDYHYAFEILNGNRINLYITTILGLCLAAVTSGKPIERIRKPESDSRPLALLLCCIMAIMTGFRPAYAIWAADSSSYATNYMDLQQKVFNPLYENKLELGGEGEWGFALLAKACAPVMHVVVYFFVMSLLYYLLHYNAVRRISGKNALLMLAFVIANFDFASFSFNGLRNGLGCSFSILGLSYVIESNKRSKIVGFFLMYVATTFHKSCFLPLACAACTMYNNNTSLYIKFWIASIFISLIAGGAVTSFFAGLGFDSRMDQYNQLQEEYANAGFKSGFRPDFLLFSSIPIYLAHLSYNKYKIRDKRYQTLINTYILANSFWVMVIRAAFSNRFAYLSWFMYGIVVAYPLIYHNIFQRQPQKVAFALGALTLFNLYMWF